MNFRARAGLAPRIALRLLCVCVCETGACSKDAYIARWNEPTTGDSTSAIAQTTL